jgi:hypothetical protein
MHRSLLRLRSLIGQWTAARRLILGLLVRVRTRHFHCTAIAAVLHYSPAFSQRPPTAIALPDTLSVICSVASHKKGRVLSRATEFFLYDRGRWRTEYRETYPSLLPTKLMVYDGKELWSNVREVRRANPSELSKYENLAKGYKQHARPENRRVDRLINGRRCYSFEFREMNAHGSMCIAPENHFPVELTYVLNEEPNTIHLEQCEPFLLPPGAQRRAFIQSPVPLVVHSGR